MTAVIPKASDPEQPKPSIAPTIIARGIDAPTMMLRNVAKRSKLRERWVRLSILLVVGIVQGWNIRNYPQLGDDEGTYLAQAWAVNHGFGLAHYTYWYDHPPFGWMQIAAFSWIPELFDPTVAVAAARFVMLGVSLINVMLVYTIIRRLRWNVWVAVLGSLLFALSPLSVNLHREVYLDNVAVLWMLAALALALSPKRHLWHHIGAGAAAAISVLSKETMLIALPAVVVALWQGTHPSTRKFSLVGAGCAVVMLGILYPLYALLRGELFPGPDHVSLIGALLFQLKDRTGSGSIFDISTGSGQIFHDWMFYDQVLLFGGFAAVLIGLLIRQIRVPAIAGLLLAGMAMRPGGYLPAMYVVQVLPFFAICLACVTGYVVQKVLKFGPQLSPKLQFWRLSAVVMVLSALAIIIVPPWYEGDRRAMTARVNDYYFDAVRWMSANVKDPANKRVVVDDVLWLDMVRLGFEPGLGAIWFYKLDLDCAVRKEVPGEWKGVDYLISTPITRAETAHLENLRNMMQFSSVVAKFGGDGGDRIEVRRINPSSEAPAPKPC